MQAYGFQSVIFYFYQKKNYHLYKLKHSLKGQYHKVEFSVKMQRYVANIERKRFRMEDEIESQLGILPLPFAGMDSKLHTTLSTYFSKSNKYLITRCCCSLKKLKLLM